MTNRPLNPHIRWPSFFCTAAISLLLPSFAQAQSETPAPAPDPLAGVPVQVLDQVQVTIGTHVVTLNRIVPPSLPTPTPDASSTSSTHSVFTRTAAKAGKTGKPAARTQKITRSAQGATPSDANGDGDRQKPYKMLFVSATVYDHRFTRLSWYGAGTPELSVFVDYDFNLFSGVGTIETSDTLYMLIFGLGNDTADALAQLGEQPPDLSSFPADHSGYQVITGSPDDHPDDVAQLGALCTYYNANQTQLATAYQQAQAAQAAQAQWLKEHPPVQPNTVVNFWPVKSNVYLPAAQ